MFSMGVKGKKGIAQGGVLLLIGIAVVAAAMASNGDLKIPGFEAVTGESDICYNIYAYDYLFRCCNEKVINEIAKSDLYDTVPPKGQWMCPVTATKCEVNVKKSATTGDIIYYIAPTNSGCTETDACWPFGCKRWQCTGESKYTTLNSFTFDPGEKIYMTPILGVSGYNQLWISVKVYDNRLFDCGYAGCTVGDPVQGADGCAFVGGAKELFTSGFQEVSGTPSGLGIMYTVPEGTCYKYTTWSTRRLVGDTCEDCEDTTDCASRYPLRYSLGGKTYGATCNSGMIQVYDCMGTGADVCTEYLEDSDVCKNYEKGSRCDIKQQIDVQCCGDGDCGANSFCDMNTYTCKQEKECDDDIDCGTQIFCAWDTLKLKTPKCQSGICGWTETPVDCCYDENCPPDYICNNLYKCQPKVIEKQACPYACCPAYGSSDSEYFFDRACASGVCCADNSCAATLNECSAKPEICDDGIDNDKDGKTDMDDPDCYDDEDDCTKICKAQCNALDITCGTVCGMKCWWEANAFTVGIVIALIVVIAILFMAKGGMGGGSPNVMVIKT